MQQIYREEKLRTHIIDFQFILHDLLPYINHFGRIYKVSNNQFEYIYWKYTYICFPIPVRAYKFLLWHMHTFQCWSKYVPSPFRCRNTRTVLFHIFRARLRCLSSPTPFTKKATPNYFESSESKIKYGWIRYTPDHWNKMIIIISTLCMCADWWLCRRFSLYARASHVQSYWSVYITAGDCTMFSVSKSRRPVYMDASGNLASLQR